MNLSIKNCVFGKSVFAMGALLLSSGAAHAQATRTWVSGVGDDANPCSRTAPCKTFAGAISKTANGGEISVLDPGGFGSVTITKSITLNGNGQLAGILSGMTNGIVVNAQANDTVILRGLNLHGGGNGTNGVRYLAGAMLLIEGCTIEGFTGNGVDVALTAAGKLAVRKSVITGGVNGVRIAGTTGRVTASLSDVSIQNSGNGVDSVYGSTQVIDSVIAQNINFGAIAEGGSITLLRTLLSGNGVGVQAQAGATVRMIDTDVFDNLTGTGCGGGTLASTGTNRKGGNVGGMVGVCSPNATIALH